MAAKSVTLVIVQSDSGEIEEFRAVIAGLSNLVCSRSPSASSPSSETSLSWASFTPGSQIVVEGTRNDVCAGVAPRKLRSRVACVFHVDLATGPEQKAGQHEKRNCWDPEVMAICQ